MKITNTKTQEATVRSAAAKATAPKSNDASTTRAVSGSSESVRLSDTGKKLAAARAPEAPDQARIERMRALVASGGLKIDAGAIADAMLREER